MKYEYLISVIVPLYNSENHMLKAIESIQKQTIDSLEIILIDDGSTDNTFSIANSIAKNDERIRLLQQKNSGPGVARNKGIKIASGKFICFVDSDDYLEPKALSTMLEAMDEDTDLVQCRAQKKYSDGRIDTDSWCNKYTELNSHQAMKDYLNNNPPLVRYAVWAKLIRKKALEGIEFPKLNNSEDVVFTTYLIDRCRKIKYIPDILYNCIIRDGSLTHTNYTSKRLSAQIKCSELIRDFIHSKEEYRVLQSRADWSCITTYINCAVIAKDNKIDGFEPGLMKDKAHNLHIDIKNLDIKKRFFYSIFIIAPNTFTWFIRMIRRQ